MFWQRNKTVVEVGLGLQNELERSVTLLETSTGGALTGAMVRSQLQALLFGIIRQLGKNASPQLSGYMLVERFQSLVKRQLPYYPAQGRRGQKTDRLASMGYEDDSSIPGV